MSNDLRSECEAIIDAARRIDDSEEMLRFLVEHSDYLKHESGYAECSDYYIVQDALLEEAKRVVFRAL